MKRFLVLMMNGVVALTASACFQQRPSVTECRTRFEGDEQLQCDTYYYSGDGTTIESTSRDLITNIADREEQLIQSQGRHYAERFALSSEQGLKIARTVHDFATVKDRSDADLADFAERLYGVEPRKLVAAAGAAQAGEPARLDAMIAETAQRFDTTAANMREIVRTLHGKLLKDQGIDL